MDEINKNSLLNIKSNYILKRVLQNISQNKLLKIIIYNKKYQSKINKGIFDYKKEHWKIEIEMTPYENAEGKFINMHKKNQPYFHIYFNEDKEEIKRNYIKKGENLSKIKVIIKYRSKQVCRRLFYKIKNIRKIKFVKFTMDNIRDVSFMFSESSLEYIDFSCFNTEKVIDMDCMFQDCILLKELNLSNFNTANVKYMNQLFFGCYYLKELDISSFKSNNLKGVCGIIKGCESLEKFLCSDEKILNSIDKEKLKKILFNNNNN